MNKIVYLLLFVIGCAMHPLKEDVPIPEGDKIKDILLEMRGDCFAVSIKIESKGVESTLYGEYDKRGRIRLEEKWDMEGQGYEKELIITREGTFVREDTGWVLTGEETKHPYDIILTVISFGNFKFTGRKGDCLLYEFTPNLLFLNPFGQGGKGEIYVDAYHLLPQKIEATFDGAHFRAEFSKIREDIRIEHPQASTYLLRICPWPVKLDSDIISNRLFLLGTEKCKIEKDILNLKTAYINKEMMERIVDRGVVRIYKVKYPFEPLESARRKYGEKLVFMDETTPLIMDSLIYQGDIRDVEFVSDEVRGEKILIELKCGLNSDVSCAVFIDTVPKCIIPKLYGKKIKIEGDETDFAILRFGSLSRGYKIVDTDLH